MYTHISQTKKQASKQALSKTSTVHNVAPSTTIDIASVRDYGHAGTKLEDYLDAPRSLGPSASVSFVVGINEDRGGVGASFIVEWQAADTIVGPFVEAIMIGDGDAGPVVHHRGQGD